MKKTRRPTIAGLLTILSGAFGSLGSLNYAVGLTQARGFGQGDIPPFVPSIIFGVPSVSTVIAIFAVVAGVLCLHRKRWRWALAGTIAATLSMLPLGLPAVILAALSRDEFET